MKILINTLLVMALSTLTANAQYTLTSSITNGYNDVEVNTNNVIDFWSPYLELKGHETANQITYLRFENITLPVDASITNAYIKFYAVDSCSSSTAVSIACEIGNASAFDFNIANYTSRLYTTASVNWNTTQVNANQMQTTPNLKSIIQSAFPAGINNVAISFKLTGNQQGAYRVYSVNGNYAWAPTLVIEYSTPGGKVEKTISVYNNDAEETLSTGAMTLFNYFLELGGLDYTIPQTTALRFESIFLPNTSKITDAYIEFYAKENQSNNSLLSISTELGNPTEYTYALNDITRRNYTPLKIPWNTGAWQANTKYRTPNLKNAIDLARMQNWTNGNALAFQIASSAGGANVWSFDGTYTYQPKLIINYLNNGQGPSLDSIESNPANISQLYINEVSGQGVTSKVNGEDWIELYNNHTFPIFLNGGIYISDKSSNKTLFELKKIYIPAKGYAILVADEATAAGFNHTNFDLKNTGESLYLSRMINGSIASLDQVSFPALTFNETYARNVDGTGSFEKYVNNTFNASNTLGIKKLELQFSHQRGVYPDSFSVSITAPAGATIRYTLDGSTTPSAATGTLYTGPIPISQTSVLKVYAEATNRNSGVIAHSYILKNNFSKEVNWEYWHWNNKAQTNDSEYAIAVSKIPVISITTATEPTASYMNSTFEYIDNHVTPSNPNYFSTAGAKRFGQESLYFPNPNLKFKFNNDFNTKKAAYPFFESFPNDQYPASNKISRLELKEGQDGPARNVYSLGYMRFSEKVSMNLQKQMGKYALNTKFVHLFVNGKWRGLKTMRDDYATQNVEEYFGDDDSSYTKVNLQDGWFPYGIVELGDGLQSKWDSIRTLAYYGNFQAIKEKVDIDDLIKFQIAFMFTDTENEAVAIFHNNAPNYMKAKFMINDTDGSFFKDYFFPGGGGNYEEKWNNYYSRRGPGDIFGAFTGAAFWPAPTAGNLEFKTLVKDQVLKQIGEAAAPWTGSATAPLSVSNVTSVLNNVVNELDILYKVDAAYMGFSNNVYNLWKNTDVPRVISQVPHRVQYSLQKWLEWNLAHTLKPVLINSNQQIINTTPITMSSANAANTAIYYTTNGSDPMGSDGVIAPNAILYTNAFTLPIGSYTIITRAFETNNWGPISYKALQVVPPVVPKFTITGINYKPLSNGDAEFLLITNTGNAPLNASSYKISDAIVYTFPANTTIAAGQTILLAKDPTLITGFAGITKYKWTSGSLNNSGEPITFKDANLNTVDSVNYGISSPWPSQANGLGYYLKLKNADLDNVLASSWEALAIPSNTLAKSANTTIDDNNDALKVVVYPNPVSSVLQIEVEHALNATAHIYNLDGQLEVSNSLMPGNNTINVAFLPNGCYIVNVIDDKGITKQFRIIKN